MRRKRSSPAQCLPREEFDLDVVLVGDEARVRSAVARARGRWDFDRPRARGDRDGPAARPRRCAPASAPRSASPVDLVKDGRGRRGRLGRQQRRLRCDRVHQAAHDRGDLATGDRNGLAGAQRPDRILLDSGANVDCRPEWLEQFGVMGSAYAKAVLDIPEPRVAVLSVGEERSKGNQLVFEAARLLEAAPDQLHRQRRGTRSLPQRRRRDRRRRVRRQRRAQDRAKA